MLKLYFGRFPTTVTTILCLGFIAFFIYTYVTRANVEFWGRRILLVAVWGLLLCITAATRDGYHLSVQNAIDASIQPGLFSAVGLQTIVGGVIAAIVVVSSIVSIFLKSQNAREVIFFVMTASLTLKIIFMEISRVACYFSGNTQWIFK